jgi:GT2 family glycosyltransferase
MDWLWLLHDDCAPEPEALEQLLAEAESRPSASILGPKLVSWTNPDRLSEIGFSIDRTGRAGVADRGRRDRPGPARPDPRRVLRQHRRDAGPAGRPAERRAASTSACRPSATTSTCAGGPT